VAVTQMWFAARGEIANGETAIPWAQVKADLGMA
jgi:hypothetical protein